MKGRQRLTAIAVLVVVFLAGGVVGGLLVGSFVEERPRRDLTRADAGERPPGPRALMSSRILDRLTQELELTDAQRDSVARILERQRSAAAAVLEEVGPSLKASVDSANVQIFRLLDPVQRDRFSALQREDHRILGRRYPGRQRRP